MKVSKYPNNIKLSIYLILILFQDKCFCGRMYFKFKLVKKNTVWFFKVYRTAFIILPKSLLEIETTSFWFF